LQPLTEECLGRWSRTLICAAALLLLAGHCPVRADELTDAESSLAQGDAAGAIELAAPFLESARPGWARRARLVSAEAMVEIGRFAEAIATLSPLLGETRPSSADADWVRLLARALQGQGLLLEATDWWLTLASFGRGSRNESRSHLDYLLFSDLTQAELAYLLWKYPGNDLLCEAAEHYAEQENRVGHQEEAERAYLVSADRCGRKVSHGDGPRWFRSMRTESPQSDYFTIGVLAPLSGAYARYGISLTNGVDVARRLHNRRARFPLRLEIADTGGTPQGCLQAVADLYDRGVRLFVGEVFSLNTLVAGSHLRGRGGVLLSPAATDSSIRLLGAGTYDCSVGPQEQLAGMLSYAADSLWVQRLGIFFPQTPKGAAWAARCRREARALGQRIVYDRSYPSGTTDFSDLLERAAPTIPDSLDGFFCPGEMRELVGLLTQVAHSGFLGTYLGSPVMGDPLIGRVVEDFGLQIVYPGETYAPRVDPGEEDGFAQVYEQIFGERADDFARRGFAAFGLLAESIESGGYCPAAIQDRLEGNASASVRRGEGRRVRMPPGVALPELYLMVGDRVRLAGPALGPPKPPVEMPTPVEIETAPQR